MLNNNHPDSLNRNWQEKILEEQKSEAGAGPIFGAESFEKPQWIEASYSNFRSTIPREVLRPYVDQEINNQNLFLA